MDREGGVFLDQGFMVVAVGWGGLVKTVVRCFKDVRYFELSRAVVFLEWL